MSTQGRIRSSFHSLMHRSRKDPVPPPEQGVPKKRGSFSLLRAQIYTRGERNDFQYKPMATTPVVPTIRVDPPDDIPFVLPMERLYIVDRPPTPPTSPGDAESAMTPPILSVVPPPLSPPDSPILPTHPLPTEEPLDTPTPPTRCPPPPPPPPAPAHSRLLSLSDDILLRILSHSPNISAAAMLSQTHRRVHAVFSQNRHLIHWRILSSTSPPISRFLDAIRPTTTAATGRGAYTASSLAECFCVSKDTVDTIHALIHSRCRSFLAPTDDLQDALFNVWTFCALFCATDNDGGDDDDTAAAEISFLRRFSLDELLDMLKAWTCLSVLLRPFLMEDRLARLYGVVKLSPTTADGTAEARKEVLDQLEDFVAFLQMKGLETLLPIVRWGENDHNQRYAIVNAKGLAHYRESSGRARHRRFLKEAVGKVYMEKSVEGRSRSSSAASSAEGWGPTIEF